MLRVGDEVRVSGRNEERTVFRKLPYLVVISRRMLMLMMGRMAWVYMILLSGVQGKGESDIHALNPAQGYSSHPLRSCLCIF